MKVYVRVNKKEAGWSWLACFEGEYTFESPAPLATLRKATNQIHDLIEEWERMCAEAKKQRSYCGLLDSNDC